MIKLFFLTLVAVSFFGCSSNDNSNTDLNIAQTSSQYLRVLRGPIGDSPISIKQKISLEFASDLDLGTVNSSTAYILDSYGVHVGLVLGVGDPDNKIIFTPYGYFEQSSSYTLVITTDLKDIYGHSLSEDYKYRFSTLSDAGDYTDFKIRAVKPYDNATDVLVQTDMVIDFSKNLSAAAQYSSTQYFKVTNTTTSTEIPCSVEIFNSLVKFTPTSGSLPFDTEISIEQINPIEDMYGSTFTTTKIYKFTTKTEENSLTINDGYKSLKSMRTSAEKQSYLVRTINDTDSDKSLVAVARQDTIDVFYVRYATSPFSQTKPELEFLYSYPFSAQATSMINYLDGYLLIGTVNNGVYTLSISSNEITQIGHSLSPRSIYGVNVGRDKEGMIDRSYLVGPEFGLMIFDEDIKEVNTSILGIPLDIVEAREYDYTTNKEVRKIYVADYDGGITSLDENGTKLVRTDINGSVRKLAVKSNGIEVISSSGNKELLNFDGSIDPYYRSSFMGSVNDILVVDSTSLHASFYSEGSKGVEVINYEYPSGIINTNGVVVSTDIVKELSTTPFLLTLNQDGALQVFNAIQDNINPSIVTTPKDADYVTDIGIDFVVEITDNYLETLLITKDSFTFKNDTKTVLVDFSFSVMYVNGKYTYTLNPTSDLISGDTYSVVIDGNISDLVGNKLNKDANEIVSFIVEGGI